MTSEDIKHQLNNINSVIPTLLVGHLHPHIGDFSNRGCDVRKITIAESKPDIGICAQEPLRFNPIWMLSIR